MKIFEVCLTNYCNFKCTYCISNSNRGFDKYSSPLHLDDRGNLKIHPEGMKQEDYDRLKDTAHDSGDWTNLELLLKFIKTHLSSEWVINLTGGEPLYYPNIDSFIEELTLTNKVVITSNISLIKTKKKLLALDRDSIFFRVGYHPEFRKTSEFLSNINYLIQNNFKYIINYVLHPSYFKNSFKYSEHIQLLEENNLIYEVTQFEGDFEGVHYPTSKSMQDPLEKSLLSTHQLSELPKSPMGNNFILAEPNGKIYECQGKSMELGNIYTNTLRLINQPRIQCFSGAGCSPSKSANNYLKLFLDKNLDLI